MTMRAIDPLADSRWSEFLEVHPRASVFHTTAWLEALRRTHGYEPVVFTSSPPGQALRDGIVFCRVNSWLTGRRLVSLPFSDHCEPLVSDGDSADALFACLEDYSRGQKCSYIQMRPLKVNERMKQWEGSAAYYLHQLDLTPDIDILFCNMHKDSTQRKIRRAERERLVYEEGRSKGLLDDFYYLLQLTRRRHGVPPQPRVWFQNLVQCFGESLKIRVVYCDKRAIAAMITMRYKDTLIYKMGCSDAAFHNLGGVQLLFWRSITEAKRDKLQCFDLGRSSISNQGLNIFKDRLGAARSALTYFKYVPSERFTWRFQASDADWKFRILRRIVANAPNRCLSVVGRLLYRHIG